MKWIDHPPDLDREARLLEEASIFALDTEADSLHSYFDKVCLIQVTRSGDDLIIDPLAVDPRPLRDALASPRITKVLHGADYDLRILGRDFGFELSNVVDTMICAQLSGEEAFGLASLLESHFGVMLDKSHQRADWAKRPLSSEMVEYAAMDTRWLIPLYEKLRGHLEELGRWEWALEEFSRLEAVRWNGSDDDSERYRKIKGAGRLSRRGLEALSRLYRWRDGIARKKDTPAFRVMGNDAMLEIATHMPATRGELQARKGVGRFHVSKYGEELLALVQEARQADDEALPSKGSGNRWTRDREVERAVRKMKPVRDRIARDLALEPQVLAPKHLLNAIASEASSIEDLDRIPAMRRWQREVVGEALLRAKKDS